VSCVCEGAKGNWEHERKLGAQKEKTGAQKEKRSAKLSAQKSQERGSAKTKA
jgi:hypothetical protein